MRASEADIIIVTGLKDSGPEHWQSRWEKKLSTARRVVQDDFAKPEREPWVNRIAETVNTAERPVVLVAHSLGVPTTILAISQFRKPIAGAFLVAPPEVDNPKIRPKHLMSFGPYPREPLPFPSIVIASRNDSFGSFEHAGDVANAWGSEFFDLGEAGHISPDTGFGPWPEGILMFGRFLARLK
ncbi:RBBP9/YdeN family alpha/beta hydrolase [Martelella endophytica]|uniref:Alpha/beta hydrolase n=1 Tax=Martelella endophytica TaxID=1486262 RepID=A0A0D5LRJ8_MAREN|nr:alpha/beta hydrolase [Martelella endophytica]AJY46565.1 alpha/beta hydrolase [Martelella endophytica]